MQGPEGDRRPATAGLVLRLTIRPRPDMNTTAEAPPPLIPAVEMEAMMKRAALYGTVPSEGRVLLMLDPAAVKAVTIGPHSLGLMVRVSLLAVAVHGALKRGDIPLAQSLMDRKLRLLFGTEGRAGQRMGATIEHLDAATGGRIRGIRDRRRVVVRSYRPVEGSKTTAVMTRSLRKTWN